ncbi:ABC transporter ATP-binding protein [Streptomyces graminilatus]|uniref:ABC transporter ATP-binding protein n=1 Tax=Streptomyces graminilatus TaxID=1464070 RepID=UPI00099E82D0|nr:ATP-binding cassette domain-containing protein [Streptomyces graminilatus]
MADCEETLPLLAAHGLAKEFCGHPVLSDISLDLPAFTVTGLLGANGAGKTTAIRMMLGLLRGRGETLFMGRSLVQWRSPASIVGAVLSGVSGHPKHSVQAHLKMVASGAGVPGRRVAEVLNQVGMLEAAGLRLGRLSLGMAQRVGIAQALLGDPRILILDEPTNGLDPHSIHWLRTLLRGFADEGRAVLVSSHQLAEMGHLADRLVVLGKGRIVAETSIADLSGISQGRIGVQSPLLDRLKSLVEQHGGALRATSAGAAEITGISRSQVGDLAAEHHVPLHWLDERQVSLEEFYLSVADQEFQRR